MSLPYHIGNGWFGGMLPLVATAVLAATGDITPASGTHRRRNVGSLFLKDARGVDM